MSRKITEVAYDLLQDWQSRFQAFRRPMPLKIGIHSDLCGQPCVEEVAAGLEPERRRIAVNVALRMWTSRREYALVTVGSRARFDLNGRAVAGVDLASKEIAHAKLAEKRALQRKAAGRRNDPRSKAKPSSFRPASRQSSARIERDPDALGVRATPGPKSLKDVKVTFRKRRPLVLPENKTRE